MAKARRVEKLKQRKKRRRRRFLLLMTPVLILVIAATAYGAMLVNKASTAVGDSFEEVDRATPVKVNPKKDNFSVLILGADESDTRTFQDNGRTDAMMVATFNLEEKSVKMLSIPRDSYVYIAEKDRYSRINHAHAWGGVKSSIETVENLLDIDIHYYVKVNFNAFVEIVDALDGVEVDVPYAINEFNSKDEHNQIVLQPGLQKLNGEETLALARTRKMDNDIERGKRQQEILKAMMKKALSVSSITKYADVIDVVGDNMTLNMSFGELTSFFNYATAGKDLQIDTVNLEGEDMYLNGAYYYNINERSLAEVSETLKNHLSNKPQEKQKTDPTEQAVDKE